MRSRVRRFVTILSALASFALGASLALSLFVLNPNRSTS
jgi:hypothetical protein